MEDKEPKESDDVVYQGPIKKKWWENIYYLIFRDDAINPKGFINKKEVKEDGGLQTGQEEARQVRTEDTGKEEKEH